jgi:toxin FitB
MMNVVDSSGWLEYFTAGQNAVFFKEALEDKDHLIVPVICLYEVFKLTLLHKGEEDALQIAGMMSIGLSVEVNREIALSAAQLSISYKIPMADSLILSTARLFEATLWTQDEHFKSISGVKYIVKL